MGNRLERAASRPSTPKPHVSRYAAKMARRSAIEAPAAAPVRKVKATVPATPIFDASTWQRGRVETCMPRLHGTVIVAGVHFHFDNHAVKVARMADTLCRGLEVDVRLERHPQTKEARVRSMRPTV